MPADTPRQRPRPPASAARPTRPMVHLYLPADLHHRLLAYEAQSGLTHADVVLDAIEAHHQTLLRPDQPEDLPPGALFARQGYRSRRIGDAEPATVTVGVRLRRAHLDQIDRLVSASTTTSRSAYIVAALRVHLVSKLAAFRDGAYPKEELSGSHGFRPGDFDRTVSSTPDSQTATPDTP